jgi:hypothetical protein
MQLTPVARDELAAARLAESTWTAALQLGLDEHRLNVTTHVLRVIRHRLRRDERAPTADFERRIRRR